MSLPSFYKKPSSQKKTYDWPPKRTVAPVKVSRQEPEPEQANCDENEKVLQLTH